VVDMQALLCRGRISTPTDFPVQGAGEDGHHHHHYHQHHPNHSMLLASTSDVEGQVELVQGEFQCGSISSGRVACSDRNVAGVEAEYSQCPSVEVICDKIRPQHKCLVELTISLMIDKKSSAKVRKTLTFDSLRCSFLAKKRAASGRENWERLLSSPGVDFALRNIISSFV